jgi:endoglucanase
VLGRRLAGSLLAAMAVACVAATPAPAAAPQAYVRVNQIGYLAGGPKRAYVLAPVSASAATFAVRNVGGATVLSGRVGARSGKWSARFPDVRAIDFGALVAPGTYTIAVSGPVAATSPPFRIGAADALYGSMIGDARLFFAAQRDGAGVDPTVLGRRPSHLNDRHAATYGRARYNDDDQLAGDLRRLSGRIDVSGGWFDAGDYVKFVETHSYAVTMLLVALRDDPARLRAAGFDSEAKYGVRWLLKMWDDRTRTLYYQVGIGDGDGCDKICGDHDIWWLPQADDHWPGGAKFRYIRHRPALRAGPPGAKISPNLAGRLTAAFALCHRVYRSSDPALASRCLRAARHVYRLADRHPGPLLSVSPHDFYPEESWQDDMELGAAELGRRADAGRFARAWIRSSFDGGDTLNLYDVSALAHYELRRQLKPGKLARALVRDIRRQLDSASKQAARDPFGSGFRWDQYDVTSHLLGLATTASFYDALTHGTRYADFARRQLGAALGANAWGMSFIVGAGTTFPHCMQHQVANLVGSLDGSAPLVRGAAVNGSNDVSQFEGSSDTPGDARACPPGGGDPFSVFTGAQGARVQDNVGAWMSVEPAIDFTAGTPLALSRLISDSTGGTP